jgi:hypothetical protein
VNRASVLLASRRICWADRDERTARWRRELQLESEAPQILDVIVEILDLGCQPAARLP